MPIVSRAACATTTDRASIRRAMAATSSNLSRNVARARDRARGRDRPGPCPAGRRPPGAGKRRSLTSAGSGFKLRRSGARVCAVNSRLKNQMFDRYRPVTALRLLLCALFLGGTALAQPGLQPENLFPGDGAEFVQVQDGGVSLQQAIEIASERVRGRVVRADTVNRDGRSIHEILIIRDDGLVRTVLVDPVTGAVL